MFVPERRAFEARRFGLGTEDMSISRPPSLRAIAAFEAAARHESFAKAGEELHLTQSAISHAIRGLEDLLGQPLFGRNGRYLSLTPAGRDLALRLRCSLAQISEALTSAAGAGGAVRLTVAVGSGLLARLLLDRWRVVQLSHPDIVLDLRVLEGEGGLCERGEVDLEISCHPPSLASVAALLIPCGPVVAVAAPWLARTGLDDCPRIETPAGRWTAWLIREAGGAGVAQIHAASDDLAVDAARLGCGVCLMPERLVEDELRSGALVELARAETPGSEPCWALWRRTSSCARVAEDLLMQLVRQDGVANDVAGSVRNRWGRPEALQWVRERGAKMVDATGIEPVTPSV